MCRAIPFIISIINYLVTKQREGGTRERQRERERERERERQRETERQREREL